MIAVKAFFEDLCPNCGKRITDERLIHKLPCEKCLSKKDIELIDEKEISNYYDYHSLLLSIEKLLRKKNTLQKEYKNVIQIEKETEKYNEFFKKILGSTLWSAQRAWAKRVFQNKSFTILAPTGVGKTAFGLTMAMFLALKDKKSYIILPTTVLAKQVYNKILDFSSKIENPPKVIAYYSGLSKKEKEKILNDINTKNFDILITTSYFLNRRFEVIKDNKFDFIFVDDVDAILKSSKNIDKILYLLGYPDELIKLALENIMLKIKATNFIRIKKEAPKDILKQIQVNSERIQKFLKKIDTGCIVISTATGRPRGVRIRLFRELMGFDIGARAEILRNVIDIYQIVDEKNISSSVVTLVRKLGKGGLLYVPIGTSEEFIKHLVDLFEKNGIKAAYVHSKNKKGLEEFIEEKIDVLIGVATYYGLLVRGLDLPHLIKYAVFVGIPHFKFTADIYEIGPTRLIQIATNIRDLVPENKKYELDRLVSRIRQYLMLLDQSKLYLLLDAIENNKKLTGPLGKLQYYIISLRDFLKKMFENESFIKTLEEKTIFSVRKIDGKTYFLVPDAMTYLQASGRTSRMYAGGISKGLSILLVNDNKLFNGLTKQIRWYSEEISWKKIDEIKIEEIMNEINKEREFIRKLIEGKVKSEEIKDLVKIALLIVESPTKARTIASFFGKPSRRRYESLTVYETSIGKYILLITASKGHILDLITKEGYYGIIVSDHDKFYPIYSTIKRCQNCGEQFTEYLNEKRVCPKCGSNKIVDQYDVIKNIRDIAQEVDFVFLGTDPDTEGEKIAWDLKSVLSPYVPLLQRIEFHEVTRQAIEKALQNPRDIDEYLVNAQIVRRIEDRWIGFVLSKKLWDKFGKKWLSAGRVQTPVLGWIINRFQEAKESIKPIFRITLENNKTYIIDTVVAKEVSSRKIAKEMLEKGVSIINISDEENEINPPPPYTTDTLLRDASQRFKLDTTKIMQIAQDLFELGLITYHRTDSIRVSVNGLAIAKQYITEKFSDRYYVPRTWGIGGAHECIRPTRPIDVDRLQALLRQGILQLARPLTRIHFMIYDLIFRRFIASQMPSSKVINSKFKLKGPYFEKEYSIISNIVIKGFTEMYPIPTTDKPKEGHYNVVDVKHRKLPTVPLYSQADIIQLMKQRRIGRPSTYAKIIKTLLDRYYVKETKRKKLLPTNLGINVYNYIFNNFASLVSENRTIMVEEIMDKIEVGEINYLDALKDFYEEIKDAEERK